MIITTPPLSANRASTSSGTFRGWSSIATVDEWLNTTGRVATSRVSRMVAGAVWDRSTSMPIRSISATTCRPRSVRPPCARSPVAESAQGVSSLWVSVM